MCSRFRHYPRPRTAVRAATWPSLWRLLPRQAAEHGHTLQIEVKILILHGLLHLAGYDHERDRGQMRRRESQLRKQFALPAGLVERSRSHLRRAAGHEPCLRDHAIALLLAILTLSSYIARLYAETGKFLSGEFQENIDVWELKVEPRLGLSRERIALSAAVLSQFSLASLALYFGVLLFAANAGARPNAAEVAQAVLGVVLVIVIFNQFLPFVFFTRTGGLWVVRLTPVIRVLFYLVLPVTLLLAFLLSIAALAEPRPGDLEEDPSEAAVEALIEAGEEEGIIEESDRDLVRSAVEFGDKVVREVMTPRPHVFAVPADMTLEDFISGLKKHPYSRVPVFRGSLDHVTGIAFAHDLLHIADACRQHADCGQHPAPGRPGPGNQAGQRTVA